MTNIPLVRAIGVEKTFAGDVKALRGVDLDVTRGSVVCLVGPSGSGKSTLLRCVNQLETPTAGVVEIDGAYMGFESRRGRLRACNQRRVAEQRRCSGMVFQQFNLFAHRTALENVMEGQVNAHRVPRATARGRSEALLDRVGVADKAGSYPGHMSGGQQQRVAIARALATDPKVLLLDEPTSALDPELVGEVLTVMRSLAHEGVTMLLVTHEIGFAEEVATEVHFMNEGRIVESGPPSRVIHSPEEERTRTFLNYITEQGQDN